MNHPVTAAEPELLPHTIAARRLRVSVRWLREEIAAGRIPAVVVGTNRWLVETDEAKRILVERARAAVKALNPDAAPVEPPPGKGARR